MPPDLQQRWHAHADNAPAIRQAEAEDLASQHARELQQLKDSLHEALRALTAAQDGQAAGEMERDEHARELREQHEQLVQKLQAQHKQQLQVSQLINRPPGALPGTNAPAGDGILRHVMALAHWVTLSPAR